MVEVMEKPWNLIFWPIIFCHLKAGDILLVIGQKINLPQKAGFSAFLSHGKFKLAMEKSLIEKSAYMILIM